ncbi:Hypothetical predicted protein [Octopus vulgaris]|uniref:Uncharacterized protein n=1 Tax=Octopus vulgaris TaxID=6645 RepID=A0AA36AKZ9_OCTVU|nr:Hypothetical predicted protein [Octopus vulgaris]
MDTLDIILGGDCTREDQKDGENIQGPTKDTNERPATKGHNGTCPAPNTTEDQKDIPTETANKMLASTGFVDTVKDGNQFKMTTGYKEDPSLTKIYNFKLNETFSGVDNFGIKFKLFCKVEDNKNGMIHVLIIIIIQLRVFEKLLMVILIVVTID